MSAVIDRRKISAQGALKLVADMLADQDVYRDKLIRALAKASCSCVTKHDHIDIDEHEMHCRYRMTMEAIA